MSLKSLVEVKSEVQDFIKLAVQDRNKITETLQPFQNNLEQKLNQTHDFLNIFKDSQLHGEKIIIDSKIISKISEFGTNLKSLLSKTAVSDFPSKMKQELAKMNDNFVEIEDAIKNPGKSAIIAFFSNNLDIDKLIIEKSITSTTNIIELRNHTDVLNSTLSALNTSLKKNLKKIFKIDANDFNGTIDYNKLIESVTNSLQIIKETDISIADIISLLLSNINNSNYHEKIDLTKNKLEELKSHVETINKSIAQLKPTFKLKVNSKIDELFLDAIKNLSFTSFDNLKNRLGTINNNLNLLLLFKRNLSELTQILNNFKQKDNGNQKDIKAFIKETLEIFKNELDTIINNYQNEIPKNPAKIIEYFLMENMKSKFSISDNPFQDIYETIIKKTFDKAKQMLEGSKNIIIQFCPEKMMQINNCIEKIESELSKTDKTLIISNFPDLMLDINGEIIRILNCIQKSGDIQTDLEVTNLDYQIIQTIVDLQRSAGLNPKLILKFDDEN